jgi:hypothetical protein
LDVAVYPDPFDLHTREAITANTSAAKAQKKESPGKDIVFSPGDR